MRYTLKKEYISHPIYKDEELVDEFLRLHKNWYTKPNTFNGYEDEHKQHCLYFLREGKWGEDYNNVNLFGVERYFEEFLDMYDKMD